MLTLQDIEAARTRLGDAIHVSPCAYTRSLSTQFNCDLFLKLENLQMTGSFKERGAANKLLALSPEERDRGVVAPSAGNHAQAVAYHAQRLGVAATIVMPKTTPLVKVGATRSFGARVILEGAAYDEAYAKAVTLSENEGLTFVHPFDDDAVIAGQGTLGLELVEQVPELDTVIVCVGGGGLAAGTAIAVKSLRPNVRVFGVEPASAPSMSRALEMGTPLAVPVSKTLADGAAVGKVGARTLSIAQRYLDGMFLVDDETIAEAILLLLEKEKTVAEGAGALSVAALLMGEVPVAGRTVAAVVSGGNIDVNLVSRIIDRGLSRTGRLMRLRVRLPDVPGALASLLNVLGIAGANILQINHDRIEARVPLGQAAVELVLETRGFKHVSQLEEEITRAGFTIV